jgi:hypothetical protein
LTNDNKGTLKGHVSKSMVCVYEINNGEMKSISHLSQRERERERDDRNPKPKNKVQAITAAAAQQKNSIIPFIYLLCFFSPTHSLSVSFSH